MPSHWTHFLTRWENNTDTFPPRDSMRVSIFLVSLTNARHPGYSDITVNSYQKLVSAKERTSVQTVDSVKAHRSSFVFAYCHCCIDIALSSFNGMPLIHWRILPNVSMCHLKLICYLKILILENSCYLLGATLAELGPVNRYPFFM